MTVENIVQIGYYGNNATCASIRFNEKGYYKATGFTQVFLIKFSPGLNKNSCI